MESREQALEARGYALGDVPGAAAIYRPVVVHDGIAYFAGAIPLAGGKLAYTGSVPSAVSVEDATRAAELCAANLLRVFVRDVGPLARIERVLKVSGFVNCDADFTGPHQVVNGASQLLMDVLGEAGEHARAAVGMSTLPLGACVEIEMIAAIGKTS